MLDLKNKIQNEFLKLAKKYPLDEIDVSLLVDKVNITRQSFYYHYRNILDLVFDIYINRQILANNPRDFSQIIDDLLFYLFDEKTFNKKVLSSNASSVLENVSFSFIFQMLQIYLEKFSNDIEKRRFVARFFASGIAQEILYEFNERDFDKKTIKHNILVLIDDKIFKDAIIKLN